ncbi:L-ribulose-5-phosphate 3-epimerase [Wukongibacter baidiensis]|uniref:L-ribulose-5-phosphate 3-epimerase n=1 Tax=Wukongibacter baidiensis TaxID=1723361 RepID=UPI003D7F9D66
MKYMLGLYEKSMPNTLSIRAKLMYAKDAGYDFLEISIDESMEKLSRLDMNLKERQDIVNACYETGIFIRTMCLSGHRKYPLGTQDYDDEQTSLEIMRKAIDLAYDLGIRIIQIAGYDEYYRESNENTKEKFRENLKKSVEMASIKGVILAFETMETEFMNTIRKAMDYVQEVNSPFLKVYPDLGNITNACKLYNEEVEDDIKAGIGNIAACHIKETVPGVFREVPFGTGHVDFKKCISAMLDCGVRMFVAEFWHTDDEWKSILKSNNTFIRSIFSELGYD